MHPLYEIVLKDLETDLVQMLEEGHDQAALRAELDRARAGGSLDALARLQEDWWQRPSPASFGYEEPNDWESIRRYFPDAESHARFVGGEAELADRLLAAWRGRCAGCQLGKPLEGLTWPGKIRSVLKAVGSWPLGGYMNPVPASLDPQQVDGCDFFQKAGAWRNELCRGRFEHVAPDDDIHYAIVSQLLLEEHGPQFTPQQAIGKLIATTPMSCLYAAGRNMFRTGVFGVGWPFTAVLGNPCRQSLGAMIRCDPFGWGAPSNPALAAAMAYRDGSNSQVRNGIYAGMFFAVLMADILGHGDVRRAIDTATQYVPPRCRFAEMIRFVKGQSAATDDWQQINAAILARWPEESKQFNHSIPNAAIVLLGLLKGQGDFTRTLGITVMCGLDTDCTGATAGSIMGCALGTRGIPAQWTDPFHDTIRCEVKGMSRVKISDLAGRMLEVARRNGRFAPTGVVGS